MIVYILSLNKAALGVYNSREEAVQRKQMMLRSNPTGGEWVDEKLEILEWTVQGRMVS